MVARIRDIAPERVIGDLQTAGIQLEVVDVLHGQLRPELAGKAIVEFPIGDPGDASQQITSLRAALPMGDAVWFLRWQGAKNRITKPGVSVNSDPADPSLYGLLHPGLQADGESFTKLSQLADHIRAVQ
jgi:hypothetical protein